jgi:hypothetical protein
VRQRVTRAGTAVRVGARTLLSKEGVRGTAVECAWLATHVALYPMFMARERVSGGPPERFTLTHLPPVQRSLIISNVEAAGTPILLIHGMVDNRSVFTLLRRGLRRRGFGRVVSMNYSPFNWDVRSAARALSQEVENLCADTGYERIHVVGHSMGGLVARYYVQRLGGDARVHTVVTLGTPHHGTASAYLVPHTRLRELRPGSDLLAELDSPSPGCTTRFLAFWSDLDQLIIPKHNAALSHPDLSVRNVFLRGVGHTSLPIHRGVVHQICAALAHLGSDGSTVTAGVTSIETGNTPSKFSRPNGASGTGDVAAVTS